MKDFKQLVRSVDSFIDIGANIGGYTVAAKCLNPELRVWAFEPEIYVLDLLRKTLQLNKWADVTAEPMAVTDFDGATTLYVPDGDLEASTNPSFRAQTITQICPAC